MWNKRTAFFATIMMCLTLVSHAANVAIISDIGEYPNLSDANLPGIDVDGDNMVRVLERDGFTIIRLSSRGNRKPSKGNIEAAFAEAAKRVGNSDRFVYYQSSHGSSDHRLICYDTTSNGENVLSTSDIKTLMNSVETSRKTLILDTCYSGGFNKYRPRGGDAIRVKFYPLRSTKDVRYRERNDTVSYLNTTAGGSDLSDTSGSKTGRYAVFASSAETETSLVRHIDGKYQSVFTVSLVKHLKGIDDQWQDVVAPTITAVKNGTDDQQTPVFSTAYLTSPVYTTEAGGSNNYTTDSLAALYDMQNVNSQQGVELKATHSNDTDDEGRYAPGTNLDVTVAVKRSGYLFLINVDDTQQAQWIGWDGNEPNLADSVAGLLQRYRVNGGQDISLSKNGVMITTSARDGYERWKAFLFTDGEAAAKFVSMWRQYLNKGKNRNAMRQVVQKLLAVTYGANSNNASTFYTSELSWQVKAK